MLQQLLKPALIGLAFVSLASIAESLPPPIEEPVFKRQQQLQQLLLQDCSVCHGKLLRGGSGPGPALTPESLAGKNEHMLARTIVEGHKETEMPAWAWKLEDHEARWVARLLRTGGLTRHSTGETEK